ncbi:hypothetical protein S83_065654 [Arachis hypogaea]
MVITTLGDLHGLYPGIILQNKVLRIKDKSTDQYIYMEDFRYITLGWVYLVTVGHHNCPVFVLNYLVRVSLLIG